MCQQRIDDDVGDVAGVVGSRIPELIRDAGAYITLLVDGDSPARKVGDHQS